MRFDVTAECTSSPERVIEIAGKDFSSRRSEIWSNVRKSRLTIHEHGADFVDATEVGTGPARFIWERSRYEWSEPGVVHATVIDSNALLPGTTFELRASPREGGCTVEMILDRKFRPDGWGRPAYLLNRVVGARGFTFMLKQALKGVEKRQAG